MNEHRADCAAHRRTVVHLNSQKYTVTQHSHICQSTVFHLDSHTLLLHSTCSSIIHCCSPQFTKIQLHSTYSFVIALLFTSIHTNTVIQHLLICRNTVVHLDSHCYIALICHRTVVHLDSHRYTFSHISHLSQHSHSLCLTQTRTIIALALYSLHSH